MIRLGQNFLISKAIARRMVKAAEVGPNDVILEIGPGRGILTEELLKKAKKVIAVEKDAGLFNFLKKGFPKEEASGKLVLIRADIRDYLRAAQNGQNRVLTRASKIVANIPYYLTGQLLRLLMVRTRFWPVVIMLQKEVAQRIMAKKKMSLLAVSVQVFAEPKIAFYVSRKNFRPQPKVDSAVVIFEPRKKDFFQEHKINQGAFFELVKTGFQHKRKLLASNLKVLISQAERGFELCKIAPNARAEDLSPENWACLAYLIHRKK